MSEHERPKGDETFQQKLERLRRRLDLLPAEQRPHLLELADVVERQRRRMDGQGEQQGNATD